MGGAFQGLECARQVDSRPQTGQCGGMTTITFDTHAFIKRLIASGMPEPQAETVTALVKEAQDSAAGDLATKADVARIEASIELAKRDLTIRLGAMIAAGVVFLSATKFFGH